MMMSHTTANRTRRNCVRFFYLLLFLFFRVAIWSKSVVFNTILFRKLDDARDLNETNRNETIGVQSDSNPAGFVRSGSTTTVSARFSNDRLSLARTYLANDDTCDFFCLVCRFVDRRRCHVIDIARRREQRGAAPYRRVPTLGN